MNIDITSYEFSQNPYAYYSQLRKTGQVHYLPLNNLWLVIGYQEAITCLSDIEIFSSESEYCFDPILLNCDPPAHTQNRKPLMGSNGIFTAPRIDSIAEQNKQIFDKLFQPFQTSNHFDLLADIAMPFSTLVILNLLGIKQASIEELNQWSKNAILNKSIYNNEFASLEWNNIKPKVAQWISDIENKKGSLGIIEIIKHKDGTFSNNEKLLDLIKVLLIGGNETTPNLITSAMHILLQNPALYSRIKANLNLLPDFIFEVLRMEAPTQMIQRTTKKEVSIGNKVIPKGASISIAIGAANRDPAEFLNPDIFDLDRTKNRILSFGFGPHYCLGAHLAKQEAEIVLAGILSNFPVLTLSKSFSASYKHSSHIRALSSLPVYTEKTAQIVIDSKAIACQVLNQSFNKFNHFPSYENYPNLDQEKWHYTSPSPFIHANVMFALQQIQTIEFENMIAKGITFLINQKEVNDTWRFWKINECRNPVPADIDDISICSKVLENGELTLNNKSLIYNNIQANGNIYTWLIPNFSGLVKFPSFTWNYLKNKSKIKRSIDAKMLHRKDYELGVMVNALLYLGNNSQTKNTINTCIHIWQTKTDTHHFYDSDVIIAFQIARAYHGGIKEFDVLEADIVALVKEQANKDSLCEMLVAYLTGKYYNNTMLLNESKNNIINILLSKPISFEPYRFFTSKDRNYYGGSDCLTAAWFLEATQNW